MVRASGVAFYDPPPGVAVGPKHSRGVKRTAARFTSLVDECSPGPIYNPRKHAGAHACTFGRCERFPKPRRKVLPKVDVPYVSLPMPPPETPKLPQPSRCTFGRRLPITPSSAEATQAALAPLNTARSLASEMKYKGRFGTEPRMREHREVTPGPGHFLKNEFRATTPMWTMVRSRPARMTPSPGPGDYLVEKYHPTSKPKSSTFARTVHDILHHVAGADSPGPALYSTFL